MLRAGPGETAGTAAGDVEGRIVTILDFLREHGLSPPEPNARGWVDLTCPLCGGAGYLGWFLEWGRARCWRCGTLDPAETLVALTGAGIGEVRSFLRDRTSPVVQDRPLGRLELPRGLGPLLSPHRKYLKSRGFDPDELMSVWGVQGIGLAHKLAWRIFIPITEGGKTLSWTTRSIAATEPRYLSASAKQEAVPKAELVLGADKCRHAIAVVEGPLDAFRLGPGAGATMGVGYSQAQVAKIAQFPVRVVVFDSESKAQQQARAMCEELSLYPGTTRNVVLDSGKDPSRASDKEVRQLRKLLE